MRYYFVLTLMFCVSTTVINAQSRDTIHAKAGTRNMRPARDLDLTPEQQRQWKTINQQSKSTADSIKNDTTMDAGMRRELQKQLMEGRRNKVMAILTPEQQQKYKVAMKAQAKERRKQKKAATSNI